MNSINFSKGELSVCRKGNCVNVSGDMAKAVVFRIATLVVINGIASILEQSNQKIDCGDFVSRITTIKIY